MQKNRSGSLFQTGTPLLMGYQLYWEFMRRLMKRHSIKKGFQYVSLPMNYNENSLKRFEEK